MAIPATDPMEDQPAVPKAVTDILGPITEKQFNDLMVVLTNQVVSRIKISSYDCQGISVRIK